MLKLSEELVCSKGADKAVLVVYEAAELSIPMELNGRYADIDAPAVVSALDPPRSAEFCNEIELIVEAIVVVDSASEA